ncbi:TlpA family protein disulfide reductase [Chitinimonas sp. BJB300]|uniref:TlpA family protein disulfide reductase n=1 Tax=Chitinimonas sp. BJB300 TaxID=1559339 RepID=UPI000C107096|nr:TlpA disulfide reductase family protein [Chitinimonas sp. BJB300]PHV12695.1 thioredoxin [Chitinimonas sp. BJB300]TSJ91260.1 TlpA family protein disulfide reductase [Chitinimonas sp. BJB300]
MKPLLKVFVAAGIAAALGTILYVGNTAQTQAPAVQYTSIKGQQTTQAALKGKVVLVNFWATSCGGCMGEMPKLIETHNKYAAQGFETIAVAMSYDPPNYVAAYTEKAKLPFFVALDVDGSLAKQFGDVKLTPTTVLIDKRGNIVQRYLGEPDFTQLHALIEEKLRET